MTAGLPGTGIGGVFYLLCALIMPFIELINLIRGRSSLKRWLFIFRQLAMAGGIIGGMWALGLLLGLIFINPAQMTDLAQSPISDAVELAAVSQKINIFHIAPVVMSIATLSIVLLSANILRVAYRRNQTITNKSAESMQKKPDLTPQKSAVRRG